jgi:hypothetical protein
MEAFTEALVVMLYALLIVGVAIPYWIYKLIGTFNQDKEKKELDEEPCWG